MNYSLLYIFTFLSINTVAAQKDLDDLLTTYNTRSIPYISVSELRMNQLNGKVVILDTREVAEFEVSHIPSAILVGYNHFSSVKISEKIKNMNTPVVVYCSLGIRSEVIGEKLKTAGYTNIKNLYGGIFEWKNKQYPIENIDGQKTDSVHTFSKSWGKWLHKGIKVYQLDR